MKHFQLILLLLLSVLMCVALCSCKTPDNPDQPGNDDPSGSGEFMLMVAAYKQNAVVDGKPLITVENEYAFIPNGKEIKPENIVRYTYVADISSLVGVPARYEIEGNTITNVFQDQESLSYESYRFHFDDKDILRLYDETEVKLSDKLLSNPENYFLVLDGMHFESGDIKGNFGFDMNNDDKLTLYDIDKDGVYDYVTYTPIYNAVTIESIEGSTFVLKGGYGSAAWLNIFAEDDKTPVLFKKKLGGEAPKEGMAVNVTIKVDSSIGTDPNAVTLFAKVESESETETAHLNASIWNSENDIVSRVNSHIKYWSTATNKNDASAGRGSVKAEALGNVFDFVYDQAGYIVKATAGSSDDIDYTTLSGYTHFQTANGTQAIALLDTQTKWHGNRTYSSLSSEIAMLYNMGIRTVWVVTSNPGYPQFSNSAVGYSSRTLMSANTSTFRYLGFDCPDHAIAQICHDKGMECYAVYKTYEGGGMATAPTGATVEEGMYCEENIFGQRHQFEDFIVDMLKNGEDYRICRRPDGANDNLEGTVDKITVDFITSSYQYRSNSGRRDEITTISGVPAVAIKAIANGNTYSKDDHHPTHAISLWTSPDNNRYELYKGDYEYEYVKDNKVLYDCNGDPMFDGKAVDVLTLVIKNIAIDEYFCAVTFEKTQYLKTDPLSLMHLWVGDRQLVTTSTDMVRNPGVNETENPNPDEYIWGRDITAARSGYCSGLTVDKDGKITTGTYSGSTEHAERSYAALPNFPLYGFEFNFEPYPGNIRSNNCFIAIGRGVIETFPGGLCEGYEEVREYWASRVEDLCKAGFDGVIVRVQHHSSIATDYKNYGFNEPIVEKYKELYGQAAYDTLMDPEHHITDEEYLRIMSIRGDYFTLFLEEAAEICHKYGATFSTTLRDSHIDPQVSSNQNEVCWWTMPKIVLDWQRVVDLCDFVTIKDYVFKNQYVEENAKEIREYARSQGKDVVIEAYDDQAGNFNQGFFNAAINDENTTGILLYELSDIIRYYSSDLDDKLASWGFTPTVLEDKIPE